MPGHEIFNFDHYCDRYVSPFVYRGILFDLLRLFIAARVLNLMGGMIRVTVNVFSLVK